MWVNHLASRWPLVDHATARTPSSLAMSIYPRSCVRHRAISPAFIWPACACSRYGDRWPRPGAGFQPDPGRPAGAEPRVTPDAPGNRQKTGPRHAVMVLRRHCGSSVQPPHVHPDTVFSLIGLSPAGSRAAGRLCPRRACSAPLMWFFTSPLAAHWPHDAPTPCLFDSDGGAHMLAWPATALGIQCGLSPPERTSRQARNVSVFAGELAACRRLCPASWRVISPTRAAGSGVRWHSSPGPKPAPGAPSWRPARTSPGDPGWAPDRHQRPLVPLLCASQCQSLTWYMRIAGFLELLAKQAFT